MCYSAAIREIVMATEIKYDAIMRIAGYYYVENLNKYIYQLI